jgi:hypothetical protein
MSSTVPPVIDPSRTRIQEAISSSPFNVFNIVAIVLILVIGFYLYRRFTSKTPQRRFPLVNPVSASPESAAAAPVTADDVPDVTEETKEE